MRGGERGKYYDAVWRAKSADLVRAMDLGPALLALREARGWTQATLAARVGVSQSAVAKLESGRETNLGLQTLVRYVGALGGHLTVRIQAAPSVPATRRTRKTA